MSNPKYTLRAISFLNLDTTKKQKKADAIEQARHAASIRITKALLVRQKASKIQVPTIRMTVSMADSITTGDTKQVTPIKQTEHDTVNTMKHM